MNHNERKKVRDRTKKERERDMSGINRPKQTMKDSRKEKKIIYLNTFQILIYELTVQFSMYFRETSA